MTTKRPRFRTFVLRLLAGSSVLVTLLAITALAYLTFERVSGWNQLRTERAKLQAEGLLRPISELVPPPSLEAIANGEKLLAVLKGLKDINKKFPYVRAGLTLDRISSPGVVFSAIAEAKPDFSNPKHDGPQTWEEYSGQAAESAPIIASAEQILRSPIGFVYNYDGGIQLLDSGAFQDLAFVLRTSAMLNLRQQNTAGAVADLDTISRLAPTVGGSRTLVGHTLALGVRAFAILQPAWEILQCPPTTDADLILLQELLSAGNLVADLIQCLEVELTISQAMRKKFVVAKHPEVAWNMVDQPTGFLGSKPAIQIRNLLWPHIWTDGDLARVTSYWAQSITRTRELLEIRNWQTTKIHYPKENPASSNYDLWRFPFSHLFEPSLVRSMLSAVVRVETRRQLTLAAIALTRYRLAHGTYPDTLAKLVPDYLPGLPHDWFDGQPLKYRPLSDGEFLLYSVNEDGTDDGGDATPTNGKSPNFTNGRDLVWPRVAVPAL